jgi:prolyl-tRNA editing enzyme YbaK/EbsC (Cys-tRNA(Pro) deacylase)
MEAQAEVEGHGIDAVVSYLKERRIAYDVVDHESTFSAAQEAKAAGVAPDHAAKTMVLRDGEQYRLAVIPASERLDLRKARGVLEASSHLRLASENEIGSDFGVFEVGAMPPLGPMVSAPEAIDRRLMVHDRILCSGGDHRHSVLIDPHDLAQVTGAEVVDVCEEDSPR